MMMTMNVSPVILSMLLSPAWPISAWRAAAPVTYTLRPSGMALGLPCSSVVSFLTMSRTASIDSLASVSPMSPERFTWT
ncbi:Uncharacterised protein [Mycobacteroides abscessus subsp. abscessus]|nr:Uncharacterised protein [Mycobacteroides abscessus subsp. abscessus]SKV16095.1 Uncharacterised protein [Mycobacteroides abscessus subsp. abscessus]